jgi:hypothetical protein
LGKFDAFTDHDLTEGEQELVVGVETDLAQLFKELVHLLLLVGAVLFLR